MRKKYISIIVLVNFFLFSCTSGLTEQNIKNEQISPGHPALEILREYQPVNHSGNTVVPYIVNLMALDILKKVPPGYYNSSGTANQFNIPAVKAYILWYLDHLNYPDKYGATGSIYDYRVFQDGREISLDTYDSIDSYAATFILLINRYYQVTGDRNLVETKRQKLADIIYLIPYVQDHDGLTVAIPGTTGKYLMDNCEALAGISAFIELSRIFNWGLEYFYRERETILRQGIRDHFFDRERGNFFWLIDGRSKSPSQWATFYPDAFAQLFPILYGIVEERIQVENIWALFHDNHGEILGGLPMEQRIVYQWAREVIESGNENNDWPGHPAGGH